MGVEAGSVLVGFLLTPESILILHIELPLEDVHWSGEIEEEAPTSFDGSTGDKIESGVVDGLARTISGTGFTFSSLPPVPKVE